MKPSSVHRARSLRVLWLAALAAPSLGAQGPLTLTDAIGLAQQRGYQARAIRQPASPAQASLDANAPLVRCGLFED